MELKITMMVDGHTTQEYGLEQGKLYLHKLEKTHLVVDDETKQLAKIEGLGVNSSMTAYPRVAGG